MMNQSKENHNPNWPYIPDNPIDSELLVVQDQKTKMSLIKNQQPDTDKIFLYAKNSVKLKYQFLINGREKIEIKSIH